MEARRYVDVTYCARFARRGWLYPDGTWRLAAVRWVDGGKYATGAGPIDCGPLHFARRADVKIYLAELRRKLGRLTCDDGAPLAQLGVP
jgi:hypothetical protein